MEVFIIQCHHFWTLPWNRGRRFFFWWIIRINDLSKVSMEESRNETSFKSSPECLKPFLAIFLSLWFVKIWITCQLQHWRKKFQILNWREAPSELIQRYMYPNRQYSKEYYEIHIFTTLGYQYITERKTGGVVNCVGIKFISWEKSE